MLTLTPLLTLLLNPVPAAPGQELSPFPSEADPSRGIPAVLQAEPSEFVTWRTPASNKLAARLTRNEKPAYDEAFRAIEGEDPDKAREAAAALASVDTVDGRRHLRRRLSWEAEATRKRRASFRRTTRPRTARPCSPMPATPGPCTCCGCSPRITWPGSGMAPRWTCSRTRRSLPAAMHTLGL